MGKSKRPAPDSANPSVPVVDSVAEVADAPQPSKKAKKDKSELEDVPLESLSPIAQPLAQHKLAKRVLRTVKKGSKARHIHRGVKEVVKSVRKGEKGLIVLAADISPMDILTHIPLLAEESGCAYVWVTSKELLGLASSTKRPTSCVMIVPQVKPPGPNSKAAKVVIDAEKQAEIDEYKQAYTEVFAEVKAMNDTV